MSTFLTIISAIVLILLGVATIYLIKVLKKANETINELYLGIKDSREKISIATSELNTTLKDIKDVTQDINQKLEKTEALFEVVEDISKSLKLPASIAGDLAETSAISLSSLLVGIKEGLKSFLKKE